MPEPNPTVSVIVPAFNEAATILPLLESLRSVRFPVERQIVVVDDGSVDETPKLLAALPDPDVRVLTHPENRGKGAAIRTGLEAAEGEIVAIQDADLEYDPTELPKLVEPILRGEADVVYGSRILNPENPASYRVFYWGGRFLSLCTNLLYGSSITDEPTCYKVFRTELLRSLNLECVRFEFCPEATAKLLLRGVRIHEIPISYRPRRVDEGKKIGWRDGIEAVWTLLKHRIRGR